MKQNNLITPSEVLLSTAEIINGGHSLQRAYQYLVLGELLYNALIHHFIFSGFRLNEFRMSFNMLNQPVGIVAKL